VRPRYDVVMAPDYHSRPTEKVDLRHILALLDGERATQKMPAIERARLLGGRPSRAPAVVLALWVVMIAALVALAALNPAWV